MNKKIILVLILGAVCIVTVLLCKCWPTRKQVVDAVINVYIKVFCEK